MSIYALCGLRTSTFCIMTLLPFLLRLLSHLLLFFQLCLVSLHLRFRPLLLQLRLQSILRLLLPRRLHLLLLLDLLHLALRLHNQSINQSINQSSSGPSPSCASPSQTLKHSFIQPRTSSSNQSINQPVNQPINICRLHNQTINQPQALSSQSIIINLISRLHNQSINQPINIVPQLRHQSISHSVMQPTLRLDFTSRVEVEVSW